MVRRGRGHVLDRMLEDLTQCHPHSKSLLVGVLKMRSEWLNTHVASKPDPCSGGNLITRVPG